MNSALLSLLAMILLGIAGCGTSPPVVQSSGGNCREFSDLPIVLVPVWHLPEWELPHFCFGLCTSEEWR
jgi:hypothetical protein